MSRPAGRPPGGHVVDWDREPDLGVVPDVLLAERHGVSRVSVFDARLTRGLSAPPRTHGAHPGREMRAVVLACALGDHIVPSDLAEAVGWSTEAVLRAQPWVADLVDDVGGVWVRR